ncbi:MAG TPA: hypothetical protein VI895_08870 [Bdellovibrionota bacterium]|nr:hypothetical protein [Bdellovibrionota bacterium]
MESGEQQSRGLRWLPMGILVLIAVTGAARLLLVRQFLSMAEESTQRLAEQIGAEIVDGKPLRETVYREFIAREPRVGYLLVAHFSSGYRSGVINSSSLSRGAKEVDEYLRQHGDTETLAHLIQPGAGFPSEYLNVVSVALTPPERASDRTPLGMVKVGFVIPGFPLGRGYQWVWGSFTCFGIALAVVLWVRQKRSESPVRPEAIKPRKEIPPVPTPLPKEAEKKDLHWLEETSAQTVEIQEKADEEGWHLLFDGESLEGWVCKGNCYVSEGSLALQPWGTSAVTAEVAPSDRFCFQVEAKKIAGEDGFVILFPCDGKSLAWVVGGWGNKHSELAGYSATRTDHALERNQWAHVEIRVEGDGVEGFLDAKKMWAVSRADIRSPSPDAGFQDGLGVAVWNTLAKFRNARYRALS